MRGPLEKAIERPKEPSKRPIEQARDRIGLRSMRTEQHRRKRWAQCQRIKCGDDCRDRNCDRELLVKLPAQAADERGRHKYRAEHKRDRDDRPSHFIHRFARGFERFQSERNIAFDVLNDNDGVIHDNADGEHQTKERQIVDGKAERMHHGKRANQRNRHRRERNDRRAPGLKKQHHDDDHESDGFQQRRDHGFNRAAHENRRVVNDRIINSRREFFLQLLHFGSHVVREIDCVRTGKLKNRDCRGRFVIEQAAQRILRRAEFDAGNVLEKNRLTLGASLDDDILEFLFRDQPALGVNREFKRNV